MVNINCQRLIVKDKSLFVVMDALNQFRRCCRMEKLLSYLYNVTVRVAASFSDTERFRYISLLHFFKDYAIVFGCNFSSHSNHLHFHDDSSMSTTSLLGRSFPYISMICWYESLPSGTFIITVGIKNKSLEAECDNFVNLNSSSLINLSMKGIANTCL